MGKLSITELHQALSVIPVPKPDQSEDQYLEELESFWFMLGILSGLMSEDYAADDLCFVARSFSPHPLDTLQLKSFDAGHTHAMVWLSHE